jgi:hypothetical protein
MRLTLIPRLSGQAELIGQRAWEIGQDLKINKYKPPGLKVTWLSSSKARV